MGRQGFMVAAVVTACGLAGLARADGGDPALAEALFEDGRQLYLAGQLEAACAKFAESERLEPKLGTLLNLASCHLEVGRTATAWAEFTEAATLAHRGHQDEREAYARSQLAELEGRLSRVTIALKKPLPSLSIRIDRAEAGDAAVGTAFPLDPGEHEVVVTAPGKVAWRVVISVAKGPATQSIEVPALTDEPRPAPPAASATASGEAIIPLPSSGRRVLAWTFTGLAVVGVGLGTYFGLRAFASRSDASSECNGAACSQRGLDLYSDVTVSGNLSTVSFGVAIASAGAALYFFLSSAGSSPPARAARGVVVAPLVGAHGGGAALQGAW